MSAAIIDHFSPHLVFTIAQHPLNTESAYTSILTGAPADQWSAALRLVARGTPIINAT
jgi:hypothetical protein